MDNPSNVHVVAYKCEHMANSCGRCLALASTKYACGWCVESCTTQDDCKKGKFGANRPWLDDAGKSRGIMGMKSREVF